MYKSDHIILYDGICGFCSEIAGFIKSKDKRDLFRFVPAGSEDGKNILLYHGLPSGDTDSVIYIEGKECFERSTAVLHILKDLGGAWRVLYAFIIIPDYIRDSVYKLIARSRHKISCHRGPEAI